MKFAVENKSTGSKFWDNFMGVSDSMSSFGTVRTSVKAYIYPEALTATCTKAEHAMAVQAERDSRRYIPAASGKLRRSGRVYGNTIVWNPPYARVIYFGNVYVDPKYYKGGFPYRKDMFRSRPGIKKISSGRKFNIRRGTDGWFYEAKKVYMKKWVQTAKGVIERGG